MEYKRQTSKFGSTNFTIKPSIDNTIPTLRPYKVLTLGDTSVGKTTLISNYCDDDYKYQSKSISTVGIDSKCAKHYEDGIKILFWDTAGQERFRNITSSYFKDADMVLFVYSIDSYEYFKSIKTG
jgi:Ras-related protein Rab-18